MFLVYEVLTLLIGINLVASATDYCNTDLCKGKHHIACGHNGKFDKKNCPPDAKIIDLPRSIQSYIVDYHNQKRDHIASGAEPRHDAACRMATMGWNNELASLAVLNVKQCQLAHDACHNTNSFRAAGQNLAIAGYYGTLNITQQVDWAMKAWYDELSYSNMTLINEYFRSGPPDVGHFTGMMIEKNTQVGCAAATFIMKGAEYTSFLFACNYAATNTLGKPVYVACPKPGEKCSKGTNPKYKSLCATSEAYDLGIRH